MALKYKKLKGRVVEKFGTQDAFAETLKVSKTTISNKFNGRSEFSKKDIVLWSSVLDIKPHEYGEYFFA